MKQIHRNTRLGALALVPMLLLGAYGCASKPLAERGIVQGVFLSQEGGKSSAVVLYACAKSEQELDTAKGEGASLQEAFSNAVRAMDAEAYYGKAELLVIGSACGYETVQRIKELILKDLQPTPAIEVWQAELSEVFASPESAAGVYKGIEQLQKQYRLQNGLERLGALPGAAVLPVYGGEGYTVNILQQKVEPLHLTDPLAAQLAACLAGQSGALQAELHGELYLEARVWPPCQTKDRISFSLYETKWKPYAEQGEREMEQRMEQALQEAFAQLLTQTGYPQNDPLNLRFAIRCEAPPGTAAAEAPALQVNY